MHTTVSMQMRKYRSCEGFRLFLHSSKRPQFRRASITSSFRIITTNSVGPLVA